MKYYKNQKFKMFFLISGDGECSQRSFVNKIGRIDRFVNSEKIIFI